MNKAKMVNQAHVAYKEEEALLEKQKDERAQELQEALAKQIARLFSLKSVTVKGPRFRLGPIELATDCYGDKLLVVKDCPVCKRQRFSSPLYTLAHIGKALAGKWQWHSHICPEGEKDQRRTPEEQVMDAVCKIIEIVGPILPQ